MQFDPLLILFTILIAVALVVATLANLALAKILPNWTIRMMVCATVGMAIGFFVSVPGTAQVVDMITNADRPADLVYLPKALQPGRTYPMLLVLSPVAQPWAHMKVLRPAADKYGWILVGDDSFRNGIPFDALEPHIMNSISQACSKYPIDRTRLFSCGQSGGAMGSYHLLYAQRQLLRGVIANTGMMPFGSDPPSNAPIPANFPRNKIAVMIASPTDFRYRAMQLNQSQLQQLGWKTKWLEFQGGHAIAPAQVYEEALNWLSQQR